ncbi:MaoC/PaaZ C-terminal domain-containing protein [Nocardioides sp. B-3]|uniref:MaoC/PaaZ C-terminal domain-containing protein n=1 Tax=Nocardioides sp. B-3 TaxID=2895565 RepID=UPI0021536E64|nr:MaoC/PaaZ C-terminal domain-containing protein [Nocardioides sp. B-3]UUZ59531.1 hypothetical protein LP418_27805 [Nocardioides sp. B-3]
MTTPSQFTGDIAVGTELPPSPRVKSRAGLAVFGPASGDLNPIHLDIDVARSAGLDDVFAHGMLSMAHLGRLITRWVDQRQIRGLAGRFVAITPVHARPTCRGRVTAVDEIDGERRATVELSVSLEDGTHTITGTAVIALPTPA